MSNANWTVKKVDESDPMALYEKYEGVAHEPQPVYIQVDHDQQEIRTFIEAEVGTSRTIFGDNVEQFAIPAGAMPAFVNKLMAEIKEALESGEWDSDALGLYQEFVPADDTNQAVWDCEEYFDSDTHLAMLADEGKTIEDVRADIESHAGSDMAFLGVEGYLEQLEKEAAEDAA